MTPAEQEQITGQVLQRDILFISTVSKSRVNMVKVTEVVLLTLFFMPASLSKVTLEACKE